MMGKFKFSRIEERVSLNNGCIHVLKLTQNSTMSQMAAVDIVHRRAVHSKHHRKQDILGDITTYKVLYRAIGYSSAINGTLSIFIWSRGILRHQNIDI